MLLLNILRTLTGRIIEMNSDPYLYFNDYIKAFDKMKCEEIIRKLEKLNSSMGVLTGKHVFTLLWRDVGC